MVGCVHQYPSEEYWFIDILEREERVSWREEHCVFVGVVMNLKFLNELGEWAGICDYCWRGNVLAAGGNMDI